MPTTIDAQTWRWWTLLRAASVLNVGLLGLTWWGAPLGTPVARAQAVCATIYTLVCGFRSFWPRVDLERTVLVDHPLSGIALGRSSATVAEMAFTVQCALFVAGLAATSGQPWMSAVAWFVVPLIAVAQTCCWLGVLTLRHAWHAAEEALWAVMMALFAAVFVAAFPSADPLHQVALAIGLVGCLAGGWVMAALDIPMYLRRQRAENEAGTRFLSVGAGFADAVSRRAPTGSWDVWRHEVAWMTPYFTAGVWLSLALVWLG